MGALRAPQPDRAPATTFRESCILYRKMLHGTRSGTHSASREDFQSKPLHGEIHRARIARAGGVSLGRRSSPLARRREQGWFEQRHLFPATLHTAPMRISGQGWREPLPADFGSAPAPAFSDRLCRAGAGYLIRPGGADRVDAGGRAGTRRADRGGQSLSAENRSAQRGLSDPGAVGSDHRVSDR